MINDLFNKQRLTMPLCVLDSVRDLDQIDSVVRKYLYDHFGILGQSLILVRVDQENRVAIYEVTGECHVRKVGSTHQSCQSRA